MKSTILSLLLLVNYYANSQMTDWVWQNPKPQGNTLNSVFAVDNNTVFAVGECGVIIKTTNSGVSWECTHLTDTTEFNSVFFINEHTGWITGGKYGVPSSVNKILKTTNKGVNWIEQQSNLTNDNLTAILFTNINTGYACGGRLNDGKIIKSTNGGNSWLILPTVFPYQVESIFFLNSNTGWAAGRNFVSKTTDGGNSWENTSGITGLIISVVFTDNMNGYATRSSGGFYRTTNNGINWSSESINGRFISFVESGTGWMTGPSNPSRVYKTIDSGLNWSVYNFQTAESMTAIDFSNDQTGWAVGLYGAIQKSTNGGMNWESQRTGADIESIEDVCFVTMNTAYACGGYGYSGEILKSTNAGTTWEEIYTLPMLVQGIDFIDENTGWACGRGYTSNITGKIWKTTNGGAVWEQQYQMLIEDYVKVKFFNSSTGYVFGYNVFGGGGKILKTTDGGVSWNTQNLGGLSAIYDISFLNINTGMLSCADGKIYKTTNSGENWNSVSTGINQELYSVNFTNENTGWVGTIQGYLYGTTDAGLTWNFQSRASSYAISEISFVNGQTGWTAHGDGTLIYTTNTGANWSKYTKFTNNGISKMVFTSQNIGYVFGSRGMVLRTTNGGGLVALQNTSAIIPKYFSILQNYPNPFNPVTNIKFNIPKSSQVSIIIYDLLGREITQLLNEQLTAGSYSVDWDASAYPSGVYFYKLQTENFTETKKMVLVK